MSKLTQLLPGWMLINSKGRVMIALAIAFSLGIQWVAWKVRFPLIAEQKGVVERIGTLETEVRELEAKGLDRETEALRTKLDRAVETVFSGEPDSPAWSDQIQQPPGIESLSIKVTAKPAVAHPVHGDYLSVVPTLWEVSPSTPGVSMEGEFIGFLRDITTMQPRRMELVELTVIGDGIGLSGAAAGFRLWFYNEKEKGNP